MGFEPTVPLGTRLFESRTFDHSDISPCIYLHISPQKHLGKRRELMERTKGYLLFNDSRKAPQNQGFSEVSFQKGHSFSSAPRYDRFATSPDRRLLLLYIKILICKVRIHGGGDSGNDLILIIPLAQPPLLVRIA